MASDPREKKNAGQKTPRFNDAFFLNYTLSSEEKAACKAWLPELVGLDDQVLKLCEAGYKVTLTYDAYGAAFAAFVMPKPETKDNQGIILAGRGSTPLKALKQALFIHYQIMDGQWAAYSRGNGKEEFDD